MTAATDTPECVKEVRSGRIRLHAWGGFSFTYKMSISPKDHLNHWMASSDFYMTHTRQLIEKITNAGHFEQLATACLRELFPVCDLVVQTGVNAEGKTIRSPIDGVASVSIGGRRELIAVHHTTSMRRDLRRKWLRGLEQGGSRSQYEAEEGDVKKTARIFEMEMRQSPEMQMTLFLTTNKEPEEELIRELGRVSESLGFDIVVVAASRLAHFLDSTGTGQWLRKQFLGVDQELLSRELLADLCAKNVIANQPLSDSKTWIPRKLDDEIGRSAGRILTLLVGESGTGKSVSCFQKLEKNLSNGGFSLVVTHDTLEAAPTIDAAIFETLKALHPSLSSLSADARWFASASSPLVILIEDLNESIRPNQVISKLLRVTEEAEKGRQDSKQSRDSGLGILCPVWPSVLSGFEPELQNRLAPNIRVVERFDSEEGARAVQRHAEACNVKLSSAACSEIADTLGNDPLFIALHDLGSRAAPERVLREFIERELQRVAGDSDTAASDFRKAITEMAEGIMLKGSLRPNWHEIAYWNVLSGESRKLLSRLARRGKLFRIAGHSSEQRIEFRHERVREYLLVECCLALEKVGRLADELICDPFFAEVIGLVILEKGCPEFLELVINKEPLAVVSALRSLRGREDSLRQRIIECIVDWLSDEKTHLREHAAQLNAARDLIGMSIGPEIPKLAELAGGSLWSLEIAKIRNGSFDGGLALFQNLDLGFAGGWMTRALLETVEDHGRGYSQKLSKLLSNRDLPTTAKTSALRFAGLIGDRLLTPSISLCWEFDSDRTPRMASYVWALSRCFDPDDCEAMDAVVEAWLALPDYDEETKNAFSKNHVSYGGLNFAFCNYPPTRALSYLIERVGKTEELNGCICQLLHGVDSPDAALFVAESIARRLESLEGTGFWNPVLLGYSRKWTHAEENGRPMSDCTREFLRKAWEDETRNKFVRIEAFKFWKASIRSGDLEVLQRTTVDSEISDEVIWERLLRGDIEAIPHLIEKLGNDENFMWWQCASCVSSAELTAFFSRNLASRSLELKRNPKSITNDDFFARILRSLDHPTAEELLIANWEGLKEDPHYVVTCLFVATDPLVRLAHQRIADHANPTELLEHFSFRLGLCFSNRPGLTTRRQATAMLAVSEYLSVQDKDNLRRALYRNGWHDLAQHLLVAYEKNSSQTDRIWKEFDAVAEEDPRFFLKERVNDLFETFASKELFFRELFAWAEARSNQRSLSLLASVLTIKGTRADLTMLNRFRNLPIEMGEAIIDDTIFAVKRASLDERKP